MCVSPLMCSIVTLFACSFVTSTGNVKRLLVGNSQPAACDSDILVTYPQDIKITATSELFHGDPLHDYSESRAYIDTKETTTSDGVQHMGAWSANLNGVFQYLTIEMKKQFTIKGVVTQGRDGCCEEWVTYYRVQYSDDCNTSWISLDSDSDTGLTFKGNTDENTKVANMFSSPITAKCIRVNPIRYHNHISMRVGLIGSLTEAGTSTGPCTTLPSPTTLKSTESVTFASISSHNDGVCHSSPCLNGGICKDFAGGYQCFCPSDATGKIILSGKRCQFVIDTTKLGTTKTQASTTKEPLSTTWFKIPG